MLDPKVASTVLPVLRADNVEQPVKETLWDARVEDREEFRSNLDDGAPQSTQKGWF